LIKNNNGTYSFESAEFPNVFIRMDGSKVVTKIGNGSGSVNCQYGSSDWEQFYIEDVSL
jgi:phospholipase C